MEQISSPQNSKVKLVSRLRSKRGREQERRFIIEYERDLRRALDLGYQIDFLLVCPAITANAHEALATEDRQFEIPDGLLKRLSYRENPTGMIAVLHSKTEKTLANLEKTEPDTALVLDDLRKPGNIGALLRTAAAAGIDAVLLVDSALDQYNPNVIRSSTGAVFCDNIYRTCRQEALGFFKRRRFQLIAADAGSALNLYDLDLRTRSAIVLGTEDRGLNDIWREHCDLMASVPMNNGLVDSLNVSVTGALFMYELRRQRLHD